MRFARYLLCFRLVALLSIFGTAAHPQSAPDDRCAFAGQAIRADTGEPLNRVVVTLRPAGPRSSPNLAASTGPDGRFEIAGVAPGQYMVAAAKNGFLVAEYGQKDPGRPGVLLALAPKQQVRDATFRMIPAGAISGRVVNEDGERVPYARVQAFRQVRIQGRRRWSPAGMATTNDLGEYRIFGLPPTRYYVAVQHSSPFALPAPDGANPDSGAEETYAPLYYPAAIDPARATPLDVAPGADVRGIDFNLTPTRSVRVRGRVKSEGAEAGARPFVTMFPRDSAFLGYSGRYSATVGPSGEFEIRGVTPGSYWISADLFEQGKRQGYRAPLEVGAGSIDGLNMVLAAVPTLAGRVRMADDRQPVQGGVRVLFQSTDAGSTGVSGLATVKPDGSFTVQNLANDIYTLQFGTLPDDLYVKSVRLGDADVTESTLDLTQGLPGPLEIVLGDGAAQVSGTIVKEGKPGPGATVVLVPDGGARRKLSRFYKTVVADQNGAFAVKGIPPGDYKLFAWSEVEEGAYLDSEFLQPFEAQGKPVALRPQGQETVQLDLIPAGETNR